MHPKDTPKGGNLTPTPTPLRNLISPWGSNHVSVTSGLDTLGAGFLTLHNSVVVEKKAGSPIRTCRSGGGLFVFLPRPWPPSYLGRPATPANPLPEKGAFDSPLLFSAKLLARGKTKGWVAGGRVQGHLHPVKLIGDHAFVVEGAVSLS